MMPEMDRVDPDISTTDILVCGKISKAGEKRVENWQMPTYFIHNKR